MIAAALRTRVMTKVSFMLCLASTDGLMGKTNFESEWSFVPSSFSYQVGPQSDAFRAAINISADVMVTDPYAGVIFGLPFPTAPSPCEIDTVFPRAATEGKVCAFAAVMWQVCGYATGSFNFLKSFDRAGCAAILNIAPLGNEACSHQPMTFGGEWNLHKEITIPLFTTGPFGPAFVYSIMSLLDSNLTYSVKLDGNDATPVHDLIGSTASIVFYRIYCACRIGISLLSLYTLFKISNTRNWGPVIVVIEGFFASPISAFRHAIDPIAYNKVWPAKMLAFWSWELLPPSLSTLVVAFVWLNMLATSPSKLFSVIINVVLVSTMAAVTATMIALSLIIVYYMQWYDVQKIMKSAQSTLDYAANLRMMMLATNVIAFALFFLGAVLFVFRIMVSAKQSNTASLLGAASRMFKFIFVETVALIFVIVGIVFSQNWNDYRGISPQPHPIVVGSEFKFGEPDNGMSRLSFVWMYHIQPVASIVVSVAQVLSFLPSSSTTYTTSNDATNTKGRGERIVSMWRDKYSGGGDGGRG